MASLMPLLKNVSPFKVCFIAYSITVQYCNVFVCTSVNTFLNDFKFHTKADPYIFKCTVIWSQRLQILHDSWSLYSNNLLKFLSSSYEPSIAYSCLHTDNSLKSLFIFSLVLGYDYFALFSINLKWKKL